MALASKYFEFHHFPLVTSSETVNFFNLPLVRVVLFIPVM